MPAVSLAKAGVQVCSGIPRPGVTPGGHPLKGPQVLLLASTTSKAVRVRCAKLIQETRPPCPHVRSGCEPFSTVVPALPLVFGAGRHTSASSSDETRACSRCRNWRGGTPLRYVQVFHPSNTGKKTEIIVAAKEGGFASSSPVHRMVPSAGILCS
jgi:hypothetical protein